MTTHLESIVNLARRSLLAAVPTVMILALVSPQVSTSAAAAQGKGENRAVTTQSKFYCNINALTPSERLAHKQLTDKLIAARKKIVETDKGHEFQFDPADISLAELSAWVAAESKCCPFFDFHIDLERAGTLLCLRLTGDEGIKPFIRSEFSVPSN